MNDLLPVLAVFTDNEELKLYLEFTQQIKAINDLLTDSEFSQLITLINPYYQITSRSQLLQSMFTSDVSIAAISVLSLLSTQQKTYLSSCIQAVTTLTARIKDSDIHKAVVLINHWAYVFQKDE